MEDVYILPEANWNAALFVILALSILTTALRLYVRIRVLRSWSLDDVLISLAMVWSCVRNATIRWVCMFERLTVWFQTVGRWHRSFDSSVLQELDYL